MKTDISKLRLIVKAILVENLKNREICRKYGVNSSTVSRYARDLNSTVLSWDELSKLDDEDFLIAIKPKAIQKFVQPDFDAIYATKLSHKKMFLEKLLILATTIKSYLKATASTNNPICMIYSQLGLLRITVKPRSHQYLVTLEIF